ncbi:MAG: DUF2933 domain-containing protein [Clostridiales bacterium]|nr:DUF2933 domain-containing protein [Clostridiales bacterium]
MNCHNDNNQAQNNHEKGHKGHGNHMLLMVLCCAIPIVLLLLLPVLRINIPALKRFLPYAVLLLCPLMHILMMPMMFRKDKKGENGQRHDLYKNQDEHSLLVKQIEDGKGGGLDVDEQ